MIGFIGFFLELIFLLFTDICSGIFTLIISLIKPERKTEYDANFIRAHEILKKHDTGFSINGLYSLSITDSYKSCLIIGSTGSKKTTAIILNSALFMAEGNSSLIFNDPSHEIRILVSGALKRMGYEIKVLDFNNGSYDAFNPIKRIRTVSDSLKLASLLVRNALGDGAKDPFWNKSAESVISVFIRYLIFYEKEEFRNLTNVLFLINTYSSSPTKIDTIIMQTKDTRLITEYKSLIAMGEKTLSGVISTAKSALGIFLDENIQKVTSNDTIDFPSFREKKTALFLNSSITQAKYYSGITSLFFQQFFNEIFTKIPTKDQLNIFFLIDELGILTIPDLSNSISHFRKYKVGAMNVVQTYDMLVQAYGLHEAENISANCYAKVYLPGQPIGTCKMLEAVLGRFEFFEDEDKKIKRTRSLLTPDEIRMTDKAIIIIGNKPPLHEELHQYFNNNKLKALTEIPPYESENGLNFETPPFIEFSND